jgi:hypothetical protein
MPILPAAQNWIQRVSAEILSIWKVANNGTVLIDSGIPPQPISYDTLNAVTPLTMAANTGEARFDLSIEPTALIPSVPTNRTAFVDAVNGSDLTGVLGERTFPFLTIAAALLAVITDPVPPSAANPALVLVWPGVYDEDPLTLPSWVTLASADGAETAVIQATTATAALITQAPNSVLKGVTLRGANGVGGSLLGMSGSGTATCLGCTFADCTDGILLSGAGKTLLARLPFATRSAGETLDRAFVASAGATLFILGARAVGMPGTTIAQAVVSESAFIGCGATFQLSWCDVGMYADQGTINAQGGGFLNCINECKIGPSGGTIELAGAASIDPIGTEIVSESSAGRIVTSAVLLETEPELQAGTSWFGTRLDRTGQVFTVEGNLTVGAQARPAQASFGAGGMHVAGMVALQNDNLTVGTWTDVTESLASATGSEIAAFPANQVDACLFIGGDAAFPGLQLATTLAKSGTLAAEYWNGAAWVAIPRWMTTLAAAPRASTALALLDAVGRHNMRFSAMPGWATSTLDGSLKYWVRLRITGAPLTTVPRLEQVLLHSNHTRIGPDGVLEHFGDARPLWAPELDLNLWQTGAGSAPTSATVSYSANVSRGGLRTFTNAVQRSTGYDLPVQRGADTSEPLVVTVEAYSSNADVGTVEMRLSYVRVPPGSLLTGALAGEQTVAVVQAAPGVAGQTMTLAFALPLPTWIAGSDRLAMTLTRLSTDAHTGDITVSKITAAGRRWRD